MTQRPFFYGWVMVVVGFLCYGLGLAPAYYSWGYYGPELIDELGLSRTEIGLAFGLFGLTYSLSAPLSAASISFLGLRQTMTLGPAIAAVGFLLLSRANSAWDCYLSFSFIAGLGIGLGNQLPCQTIASFWFKKYRARALAVHGQGVELVPSRRRAKAVVQIGHPVRTRRTKRPGGAVRIAGAATG